jgi:hypothetical protein
MSHGAMERDAATFAVTARRPGPSPAQSNRTTSRSPSRRRKSWPGELSADPVAGWFSSGRPESSTPARGVPKVAPE